MKLSKRSLITLACGLCCALCVGLYLANAKGEAQQARAEALARYGGDQIEVCVANRDMAAGEVVEGSSLVTKLWVADLLPDEAVTDPSQIVGQRLGSAVYRGEVMSMRRTETSESELNVPEGLAAISVPARAVQAVGGSVEAGMAVDVYATGPASTSKLVGGALVLASSATSEGASGAQAAWITLAVQPERVQEIVAAAQNLELYFVIPPDGGVSLETDAPASGEGAETGAVTGAAEAEKAPEATTPTPEDAAETPGVPDAPTPEGAAGAAAPAGDTAIPSAPASSGQAADSTEVAR